MAEKEIIRPVKFSFIIEHIDLSNYGNHVQNGNILSILLNRTLKALTSYLGQSIQSIL